MCFIATISIVILACLPALVQSQTERLASWNGYQCAVVLTYDDGLNVHLDHVVPVLDSFGLKGTFYANCDAVAFQARIADWRAAAANGHELGNHTLFHPCDGTKPTRDWVQSDRDLSKYSVDQMVREIRLANTMLFAVDGKTSRTFAYTCGDTEVQGQSFKYLIGQDFIGARGTRFTSGKLDDIDHMEIPAFYVQDHTAEALMELVDQAIEHQLLIVFLFHGVGGEHNLNIDKTEHDKLVAYIAGRHDQIWIASMVDIADYIR